MSPVNQEILAGGQVSTPSPILPEYCLTHPKIFNQSSSCLSVCPSIHPSVCIRLPVCPSVCPSTRLFGWFVACLLVCLIAYLPGLDHRYGVLESPNQRLNCCLAATSCRKRMSHVFFCFSVTAKDDVMASIRAPIRPVCRKLSH